MLVLHIGYAKSATTFLQKNVYPNFTKVNYLGRHYEGDKPKRGDDHCLHDFVFKNDISTNKFAEYLENNSKADQLSLLSHENFLRPYQRDRLLMRIKGLEEVVGPIKIMVTVRKQTDLILSRFVHDKNARAFNSSTISDALDFEGKSECFWPTCSSALKSILPFTKCACRKAGAKVINVPFYNYHELSGQLSDIFGLENVHFIVTEKLKKNIIDEVGRLTTFLNIDPIDDERLLSLENRKENVQKNLDSYELCRTDFIDSGKKAELHTYFSPSNRLFSDALNLGLEKYDYF